MEHMLLTHHITFPPFSRFITFLWKSHFLYSITERNLVSAAPPPLHEHLPDLSPAVEEVVMRALAKGPEQRFPSVQDFANALQHAAHPASDVYLTIPAVLSTSHGPPNVWERPAPGEAEPFWKVPTSLTPLVGREQDVAAVCALLERPDVHLLTLLGVGGIGKTRLSIQVAIQLRDRFADGVCFVGLASISDPSFVISTIAHELGLQEAGAQPLEETVKAWLRDKHFLLLLDNFEQIVSAAPLLEDLLAACPRLVILVTSREVLHLSAEHLFPVPPLSLPDLTQLPELEQLSLYAAVSLFLQRAQALKPDFILTPANAHAIAEICGRLDGLPLAIELAAARIRLLPPQALLSRLSQRLRVLTGGSRTLPERQQTLHNTIQWSYDLLNEEEQRLFRRLSVFVGGCTLEAAEAVCGTSRDASDGREGSLLDNVASLMDKSLVRQAEQEGEEPRLMMLETIREYGLEMLTATGDREATQAAHAHFFLALAELARPELHGSNQAAWVERLEQEHDNLRAALEWALEEVADEQTRERREVALRLSAALKAFWRIYGHYREGRTFLERAMAQSEGTSASLRAKVLGAAAEIAYYQGDLDQAEVLAQQCLALDRELGDTRGIDNCLFLLGQIAWTRGKTVEAITLSEERIRLIRQIGQPGQVAHALWGLAFMVSVHGEYTRGQALFEEALVLFRKAGNERGVGATLVDSAWWLLLSTLGDAATIRQRLQQGQALITKVGDKLWSAMSSGLATMVALSEDETARAFSLIKESLAIFREMDTRWYLALTLHILGRVEAQQGEPTAAYSSYQESLALCRQLGEKWIIPFNLEGLASIVATQGELRWAAQLWGAAEAQREGIASPLLPYDRASYEQAVAVARGELGEEAFATAWAKGRTMTPEQALAAQGSVTMPTKALAESSSVPHSLKASTNPAGLTAREVEVLRLVAQGLTDAQVAEHLVISRRTVNFHLTSIYSKLGVSSRNAATRYAIEQHLL